MDSGGEISHIQVEMSRCTLSSHLGKSLKPCEGRLEQRCSQSQRIGDGCVHCFTLWTCGAEWGASGVSTVFSLVDETRRARAMQGGEEMQGDRWVWRAREQSGLHTDVGGIGGQLEASPGPRG